MTILEVQFLVVCLFWGKIMSYHDIYFKRLNRFGESYQERIQGERERNFDLKLASSLYKVEFLFNNKTVEGSLERYKQDNTRTLAYLLTRISINIPNGTILLIPNKDDKPEAWMVYYLENIKASGYNRYVMLKMSHLLTWTGRDGYEYTTWAYLYGQENNMLKDEIRSRSRMDTIYSENLKLSFFILPKNENINKDDYFIVGEKPFQEYYRVTGFDRLSTDGVEYVSIDPVYEFDLTPVPEKTTNDKDEDFFWLEGGQKND